MLRAPRLLLLAAAAAIAHGADRCIELGGGNDNYQGAHFFVPGDLADRKTDPGSDLFSVSAWVKPADRFGGPIVHRHRVDSVDSFFLEVDSSRAKFTIDLGDGLIVATGTSNVADGDWHHLFGVRDGRQSVRIYVDGLLEDTATGSGSRSSIDVDSDFMVGAFWTDVWESGSEADETWPVSYGFTGRMDEVAFWDDAISAAEIAQIYNKDQTGDPRLVYYWKFDATEDLTEFFTLGNEGDDCDEACEDIDSVCANFFPPDLKDFDDEIKEFEPDCKKPGKEKNYATIVDPAYFDGDCVGYKKVPKVIDCSGSFSGYARLCTCYPALRSDSSDQSLYFRDWLPTGETELGQVSIQGDGPRLGARCVPTCINGNCDNGNCDCDQGWYGEACDELRTEASACTVAGDVSGAIAGDDAQVVITARDYFQNPIETTDDEFDVKITRQDTGAVVLDQVASRDFSNPGQYEQDYSFEVAGEYRMTIKLGGTHISGSPLTLQINPGAASADNTVASINSANFDAGVPSTLTAGATRIYVQLRDEFDNPIVENVASLTASYEAPFSNTAFVSFVSSRYQFDMSPTIAGTGYSLNVEFAEGDAISGSPFTFAVTAAGIDATQTAQTAAGPGLTNAQAGQPASFTFFARDQYGNKRAVGSDSFSVSVTQVGGQVQVAGEVTVGANDYTASYVPQATGAHTLELRSSEIGIVVSAAVMVVPGPLDAGQSSAALQDASLLVNEFAQFEIVARDALGNPRPAGADAFELEQTTTSFEATTQVQAQGANVYAISYMSLQAGTHVVRIVTAGDGDVVGGPFSITFAAGPVVLDKTTIAGPGASPFPVGSPAQVQIQGRDQYGNPQAFPAGTTISATLVGGADPEAGATVIPVGFPSGSSNSPAVALLNPATAATYMLRVWINDDFEPPPSPLVTAAVATGLSAPSSTAFGDGLLGASEGQPSSVFVQLRDDGGNALQTFSRTLLAAFLDSTGLFDVLQEGDVPGQARIVTVPRTAPIAVEYQDAVDLALGAEDGPPRDGVPDDNFSVIWTALFAVPATESYTFCVKSDDGFSLRLDDQVLAEFLAPRPAATTCAQAVALEADSLHRLVLLYMEKTGQAQAKLTVSSPTVGTDALVDGDLLGSGRDLTVTESTDDIVASMPGASITGVVYEGNGVYRIDYNAPSVGIYQLAIRGRDSNAHIEGSPFGIEIVGAPSIIGVDPASGPVPGGTRVTIEGTNFLPGSTRALCRFGGNSVAAVVLSETTLECDSPAGLAAGDVDVRVSNDNGNSFSSTQQTFLYYQPLSDVAGADPERASTLKSALVTVSLTGGGVVDLPTLTCRFEGEDELEQPVTVDVGATFVDASTVTCNTPEFAPGIATLSISNNGQDFNTGTPFTFIESFSRICREEGELEIGLADRVGGGFTYHQNLAVGRDVSESDDGYAPYTEKADIVDADRCCSLTDANEGFRCGLAFAQRTAGDKVQVTVRLPRRAFVNEIISSWFDPCRNVPAPSYSLRFEDPDNQPGVWQPVLDRATTSGAPSELGPPRPCYSIRSDAGQAGVCIDFFGYVLGSAFRLEFENSAEAMGLFDDDTDGGWLFELEVHGVFEDEAYRLAAEFAQAGTIEVPSEIRAAVPEFQLTTLNLGFEPLGALDTAAHTVTVAVYPDEAVSIDDSGVVLIEEGVEALADLIVDPPLELVIIDGALTVTEYKLDSPPVGSYALVLSAAGLQSSVLRIEVTPGPAARLAIEEVSFVAPSTERVTLPELTISVLDAGRALVGASDTEARALSVSVVDDTAVIDASTATATAVDGTATLSGVVLLSPPADVHILTVSSPGLAPTEFAVTVVVGPAHRLVAETLDLGQVPSEDRVSLAAISLVAQDAGGSFVPSDVRPVLARLDGPGAILVGEVNGVLRDGALTFDDLSLTTPTVGQYSIVFESTGVESATVALTVVVGDPAALVRGGSGASPVVRLADARVPLGPFQILAVDAGGTLVGTEDGLEREVVLAVTPAAGLGAADPEVSGDVQVGMINGNVTFTGLALVRPAAGAYTLNFTSPGLDSLEVPLEVAVGEPALIELSVSNLNRQSLATVALGTVDVLVLDGARNLINGEESGAQVVEARCDTLELSGETSITTSRGSGSFQGLVVLQPPVGIHEIRFLVPGTTEESILILVVSPGPPSRLAVPEYPPGTVITLESLVDTQLPSLEMTIEDAGGAQIGREDTAERVVSVSISEPGTLAGVAAWQTESGAVDIDGVSIVAPSAGLYEVRFSSFGLEAVSVTVEIVPGPAYAIAVEPASLPELPAEPLLTLDPLRVQVVDAGGSVVNSTSRCSVEASLRGPSTLLVPQPGATLGAVLESGRPATLLVALDQPLLGDYAVVVALTEGSLCTSLVAGELPLTVTVGEARKLDVQSPVVVPPVVAAALVELPEIVVAATDLLDNFVGGGGVNGLDVRVGLGALEGQQGLAGTLVRPFRNGTVTFDDVALVEPPAGVYTLQFSAAGLSETTLSLEVGAGPASGLRILEPLPSRTHANGEPFGFPPVTQIVDQAGNAVEERGVLLQVSFVPEPFSVLGFRNESDARGQTSFRDLTFVGTRGQAYTMVVSTAPTSPVSLEPVSFESVVVNPCPSKQEPRESGCTCGPGFFLSGTTCLECPSDTYKDFSGPEECQSCPEDKGTATLVGQTSVEDCRCNPDFYSLAENEPCQRCEPGATCPGGTEIYAQDGFWQVPESLQFIECNPGACIGGEDARCEEGYEGPRCAVCSDGYGGFGITCELCPEAALNWFLLTLLFLALLLVLVFLVRTATGPKSYASISAKILVNHMQSAAFLLGYEIAWPSPIQRLFEYFAVSTLSARILSVSCAFPMSFYEYFLWYLLLPVISIAVVALIFMGVYVLSLARPESRRFARLTDDGERSLKEVLKDYFIVTLLVVVFLSHPTITKQIFEVFNCEQVGSKWYLSADLSRECFNAEHRFWSAMGAVMLIGYCLGLPILGIVLLFRNRYRLRDKDVSRRFLFMYDGYNSKTYYWEMIIMLRKVVVVFFLVFARTIPLLQITGAVLLFSGAILAHITFNPYQYAMHRKLEAFALTTTFVTVTFGFLFSEDSGLSNDVSNVVFVVPMLLNVMVLAAFVFLVGKYLLSEEQRAKLGKFIGAFQDQLGGSRGEEEEDGGVIMSHNPRSSVNLRKSQMNMSPVVDSDL